MIEVKALTPDLFPDLASLFETEPTANGCWCMWFIIPVKDYHAGGAAANRARFTDLALTAKEPLGLLAYLAGKPVGWCAVGPKSRFSRAVRTPTLKGGDVSEQDRVWLVPCFYVHPDARQSGVTRKLLDHAVTLARSFGAVAIEGFPFAGSKRGSSGDTQVGTERLFASCDFSATRRPSTQRVVMRRDLVEQ